MASISFRDLVFDIGKWGFWAPRSDEIPGVLYLPTLILALGLGWDGRQELKYPRPTDQAKSPPGPPQVHRRSTSGLAQVHPRPTSGAPTVPYGLSIVGVHVRPSVSMFVQTPLKLISQLIQRLFQKCSSKKLMGCGFDGNKNDF